MKNKTIALLFSLLFALTFFGCSRGATELKNDIEIPENGVISAQIIEDARREKAILTFTGESNGKKYEWTLFGSDITENGEINLKTEIFDVTDTSFSVRFSSEKAIGYPAVLSVCLNAKWDAHGAVVYRGDEAVSSATITGGDGTTVNFTVTELVGEYTVKAESDGDTLTDAQTTETVSAEATEEIGKTTDSEKSTDGYLTPPKQTSGRVYSDGKATERDKYKTDPVPEGKPMPVEPQDQDVDTAKKLSCTFSIECTTILNNLKQLNEDKLEVLPSDGIIFAKKTVTFSEGESVFDVLQRICRENGIHLESSWTPVYNSAYVEGINNLYEFDCGELSGWMYRVNGWYPNYGCSRYALADGDTVEWRYTCDLGKDVGCDWMANATE